MLIFFIGTTLVRELKFENDQHKNEQSFILPLLIFFRILYSKEIAADVEIIKDYLVNLLLGVKVKCQNS